MKEFNSITYYKGCYSILFNENLIFNYSDFIKNIPNTYLEYKTKRDGNNKYHLTVITAQEMKNINKEELEKEFEFQKHVNFNVLGLGTNSSCYYLVCVSSQLDNLRMKFNLKSFDFHITLGFAHSDQHNISKSIDTLINPVENCIDRVINNLSLDVEKNIKLLKQLKLKYPDNYLILKNISNEYSKKSNYQKAFKYSRLIMELFPTEITGYYLLIRLMEKIDSYDIDLLKSFFLKLTEINIKSEQNRIIFETIKKLNELSIKFSFIEFVLNESNQTNTFKIVNYDFTNKKISQINFISKTNINTDLTQINTIELLTSVISNLDKLVLTYKNYLDLFVMELNNQIILGHKNPNKNILVYISSFTKYNEYFQSELPINFSSISLNLFGSGMVSQRHIQILNNLQINTIINLIGEEKPKDETIIECKKFNINLIHIGFGDRTACDFETFLKIQDLILKNTLDQNKCLIHCKGGIGRTNMILGGFLMNQNNLTPAESIGVLKKSRKVIMVPEQIMLLKKYYGYLTNLKMNNPNFNIELPSSLKGLVIMMGLPCSGKSTLSLEIYSKYSSIYNVIHLNQDEIGKSACEQLLSSNAKTADLIIIDRCNPNSNDRTHWINIYRGLTSNKIIIVFLNLGLDTSLERLKTRTNHLTLDKTGSKIIEDMSKKISLPLKSEGWGELVQINTIMELEEFKQKIGLVQKNNLSPKSPKPLTNLDLDKIIKFPRTKHLMNLGAMTRDDLLMDKSDIESMLSGEIFVEEKIDGANLGFRLNPTTNSIIAQNRSHYVCSTSHPQFKKLDQWIESNKIHLTNILSQGNYIIYGEWLYSKHSINYTKLPDWFIMFDLYDVDTNTFFSRTYVEKIIKGTGITLVPLIFKGKTTLDKLKILAQQTKSQYYDGIVEGIYIRSHDPNYSKLKLRAKIVRQDFISGDEHWTKGKQTLNTVIKY